MAENTRIIEVERDGVWLQTEVMKLSKGDKVRMFNLDGTLVTFNDKTEFIVNDIPYLNHLGVPSFEAKAI